VNTESVQCICIAYSEVRVTEISEQLSKVDQSDYKKELQFQILYQQCSSYNDNVIWKFHNLFFKSYP